MELITAIALLCQIYIGIGSGNTYINGYDMKKVFVLIASDQKRCQKKLATCILKKDKNAETFRTSTMLKCIQEQK